jgi:hypothetical protein
MVAESVEAVTIPYCSEVLTTGGNHNVIIPGQPAYPVAIATPDKVPDAKGDPVPLGVVQVLKSHNFHRIAELPSLIFPCFIWLRKLFSGI